MTNVPLSEVLSFLDRKRAAGPMDPDDFADLEGISELAQESSHLAKKNYLHIVWNDLENDRALHEEALSLNRQAVEAAKKRHRKDFMDMHQKLVDYHLGHIKELEQAEKRKPSLRPKKR